MNKTILKIYICFTLSSALIAIIILLMNFLGMAYLQSDISNLYSKSPSRVLNDISESLTQSEDGLYLEDTSVIPESDWCIVIDSDGRIIWEYDKPDDIPDNYTLSDMVRMTRWYLNDYPVYVSTEDYGIIVLGTPKNSVGKYQIQYSMEWFNTLPQRILSIVFINLALSTILAFIFGFSLYRRLKALTAGIDGLRLEKSVHLSEKGIFKEINKNINETSRSIARKNASLLSRDNARSNWIAGVSHDIRTPLAMVMGNSEALASAPDIPEQYKEKAKLITAQSLKIKKMIEDLNLISSLEYDMQPSRKKEIRICPLIRNIVTEIINGGLSEKYEINLDFSCERAIVMGDESLIERALFNLISNSIVHNENGCIINISEYRERERIFISISDNGEGVPESVIKNISVIPKSAHGLGLPMAYRIFAVHGGDMKIKNDNGLSVLIELPEA